MRVATWNINSIRARLDRVLDWLAEHRPDVLCLQEIKVETDSFPADELAAAGYTSSVHGQKAYNGVAILTLEEPEAVFRGLPGIEPPDDPASQARLIGVRYRGVEILSAYFPNGATPDSEKYGYKLEWMDELAAFLADRFSPDEPLLLCGDYNVAPEARDVHDPEAWAGTVLFNEEVRGKLAAIRGWGLTDVFRLHCEEAGKYSWWDYQRLAFPKGRGLRIDHIDATAPLVRVSTGAFIDREARKGKKPSDHAPVVADFDL